VGIELSVGGDDRRLRYFAHGEVGVVELRMGRRIALIVVFAAAVAAGCGGERSRPRPRPAPGPGPVAGPELEAAIAVRVAEYGPAARDRLRPSFAVAGVPYPPARFLLLGLKRERELQLYASGAGQPLRFIQSFRIAGASGALGPKLREGDHQVPEGIYRIAYLNPRSIAHLSLALTYPNDFDSRRGPEDGRDPLMLGGDIMIHGGGKSVGCLAIGDLAAEDLFVLAADSDWHSAVIIISPVDFRRATLPFGYRAPVPWVDQLYTQLRTQMFSLPAPGRFPATSVAAGAY
jgi:hypothetical protein